MAYSNYNADLEGQDDFNVTVEYKITGVQDGAETTYEEVGSDLLAVSDGTPDGSVSVELQTLSANLSLDQHSEITFDDLEPDNLDGSKTTDLEFRYEIISQNYDSLSAVDTATIQVTVDDLEGETSAGGNLEIEGSG